MIVRNYDDRTGGRRLSPAVLLLAWVVGVPVLLAGLGAREIERGQATATTYTRRLVELPVSVIQLRPLAATDPYAAVRFEGSPTAYGAALAADKAQEALARVERDLPPANTRLWVSYSTLAGASLALLAGLLALAGAAAGP